MRPRSGPSLPTAILEEIDKVSGQTGHHKGTHGKLSRKETRKQDRGQKKQRKAEFFTYGRPPNVKRTAENEHGDSPDRKRVRLSGAAAITKPPTEQTSRPKLKTTDSPQQLARKTPHGAGINQKSETPLQKLAQRNGRQESGPTSLRSEQEKREDAYIKHLESKLGWTKGGTKTAKYGRGLEDDGLDDLLRDVESIEASIFSSSKHKAADMSEEAEDGDTGENQWEDEEDSEDESSEEDEEEEEALENDEFEVDGPISGEEGSNSSELVEDGEDEWSGFGEDTIVEHAPADGKPEPTVAVSGTRYIPPHLRNVENTEQPSEDQVKLTRQLKGLLNRMSEQNISTILDSIEQIYRNQRRHDVTSTITKLIIDGISSHSMLLDSYVVLHAALISSLHKIIGVEFAAYFVQNTVTSYEGHFTSLATSEDLGKATNTTSDETRGKECSNLIVLLSELYNFQVVSCLLVYDFIRGLLDGNITEFKIELLLKIVRNSGQQLRTDDPSALKDIIQIVHLKLPAQQNAMSSRTRFMVETLTNLKNNKLKRNSANSASADATERLKKFLSGINKNRHVMAHEPLRIGLADLHAAGTRGKWWLVGAAWGGDPLVEKQAQIQQSAKKIDSAENVLLKLAKKQGMNTDIRRSIFVVLMSSEDYIDACERLSQLKLTEVQQREIVRVLLHCCGNERSYNPYYAFVAHHLCRTSHSYKVTLQFCLWDFLRDMGESSVGGAEVLKNLKDDVASFDVSKISNTRARNVARAYAWWIAKDSCTLAILKPVDFTTLKPQTRQFFIELFTHMLVNTQLPTPLLSSDSKDFPNTRNRAPLEEVFIKATRMETLALGLVYFFGQTLSQTDEGASGFIKWAVKAAVETLRTGVDIAGAI